jgi:protein SCO1
MTPEPRKAYHRTMKKLLSGVMKKLQPGKSAVLFGLASLLSLGMLSSIVSGCKQASPPAPTPKLTKTFKIRGKVVGTDPATGEVTLDHEAVPGFMGAMVMPYKLADHSVMSELHAGDRIAADLLVDQIDPDPAGGYRNARLDNLVIVGQAKPDYVPAVQYHDPTPGDLVPNFSLLNQSGKLIRFDQFKGRVVLLTFIYTRCQFADFCPRMSRNFAEIDHALAADPSLYAKTHLLSISFDPAYDTPAVLRSYGGAYTGNYTKEKFTHWDFAAPSVEELPKMTQFFNVGVTPGDNKSLTHSLSTVLIGKDGKILAWYPTNDWKPTDVLTAIKTAAS